MLCEKCIFISTSAQNHPPGFHGAIRPTLFQYADDENTWTGSHHTEPNGFISAVNSRCYICSTIYRDLNSQLRNQAALFHTFYSLRLVTGRDDLQDVKDQYELEFMVEILYGRDPIPKEEAFNCTGIFKIIPRIDFNVPMLVLGITENNFSDQCQERVQKWLHTCAVSKDDTKHDRCRKDWRTKGINPTRLLRISDDIVTLETVETTNDRPIYVTMSHCWEEVMPLKLTEKTKDTLSCGMSISELPQKFQEAIQIAKWLKVDRIWIDAFCIFQDSEDDWLDQSSRMGDIYAGSYCNIAATRRGLGCFTHRNVSLVNPYMIANPRSQDPQKTHVIGYDDFWSNSLLDTELNNRCWVLQERLLSPRTIHFGQEQIFWECRTEMACEAYPDGIPEQFKNHKTKAWRHSDRILDPDFGQIVASPSRPRGILATVTDFFSKFWRRESLGLSLPKLSLPEIYGIWSKTIERYMECDLSEGKDKLVAISGIAQKVAAVTKERYLAGLWDNPMLSQSLLWYVLGRKQASEIASARSPDYRAPSWSWASLEAKIIWNWPAQCDKTLIKIENTTVEERKGSKLGGVSSAVMHILGTLFEAKLHILSVRKDGTPDEDGRYGLEIMRSTSGTAADTAGLQATAESIMEPSIFLDVPLMPKAKSTTTYLLPVCTGWKGRTGYTTAAKIAGLLLRRCTNHEASYERIGMFSMDKSQADTLGSLRGGLLDRIEDLLVSHKSLITLY